MRKKDVTKCWGFTENGNMANGTLRIDIMAGQNWAKQTKVGEEEKARSSAGTLSSVTPLVLLTHRLCDTACFY